MLAVDAVGGVLRAKALELLAPFGRLFVLGNASGDDRPSPGRALAWHSTGQRAQPRRCGAPGAGAIGEALSALVQLLDRGLLREPRPSWRHWSGRQRCTARWSNGRRREDGTGDEAG